MRVRKTPTRGARVRAQTRAQADAYVYNCTCRVERRSSSAPTHSGCVNDDRRQLQPNTYAHLRAHITTLHIVHCGKRPRPLSRSPPRLRCFNPNSLPRDGCACSPLSRRRVQRFFAGMARVQEGKSRVRENRKKAWVTWRVGNKSEGNQTSLPVHIIKFPFLFSLHQLATVLLRHASHQSARFPLSPLRTRNAKCKKGTSEHGHCPRSKYKSAPKAPPRGVRT